MQGAQGSLARSPTFPRALLAEFLLTSPPSPHASFIFTPASSFTELMNNDRPVIRLTSVTSLPQSVTRVRDVVSPPSPAGQPLPPHPCSWLTFILC